jgi:hypothetical protein
MPETSAERRHLRARKARLTQLGVDTSEIDAELKAVKLEEHIRQVVDSAPPLSTEQRDRLALLLRPTAGRLDGPDAA